MDMLQLSNDLAQSALEADFYDALVHEAPEKARKIREMSDQNIDPGNPLVQDFRKYQRAIYIALKKLDAFGLIREKV